MEKDPDGNDYIHDPKSAEVSKITRSIIDSAYAGGCENSDEVVGWLARKLAEAAVAISEIVVTEGEDAGVVLLSNEGSSHYNERLKCSVFDLEYFSPLGEALIALHRKVSPNTEPTHPADNA